VNVEAGEMTGPDAAQPLVVLADTSVVRVRAFVEELDAPRVQTGMTAQVTADGVPDKVFSGRVASVSPRMVPKSIYAERPGELYDTKVREVLIELEPNDQLIIGLRVDVTVVVGTAPQDLQPGVNRQAPAGLHRVTPEEKQLGEK
jgi:HlyD family secretion protein